MKALGIKEIDNFISTELKATIFERYYQYEILSEADLQSHIWQILYDYFRAKEEKKGTFTIHSNNYLKDLRAHPDLIIFRKSKPYIIIELKEWRTVNPNKWSNSRKSIAAKKDFQRLLNAKKHFWEVHHYKIKRGYFLYISWEQIKFQEEKVKGEGARFLFPIRLVNEGFTFEKDWKEKFKKRSKYISKT